MKSIASSTAITASTMQWIEPMPRLASLGVEVDDPMLEPAEPDPPELDVVVADGGRVCPSDFVVELVEVVDLGADELEGPVPEGGL